MAYLGLDIGTSGTKASVIDYDGSIRGYSHVEYSVSSPKYGYVEIDANTVWEAAKQVIAGATAQHPDIEAIAIASFGEAVILLDENDRVLAPSIYYSDIRGTEEVQDIIDILGRQRLEALTGMPINPMYSANKLLWIKKHNSELYKQSKKIMLFGDYIGYMLTGEAIIDYSLASRTMLFDINKYTWSHEICDALDIDAGMFSKAVLTGTPVGTVKASVAAELGLSPKTLIVAGGHDQPLAALGSGAVSRGDSVDGMGSSECITYVLSGEDISANMFEKNYCCEPFVFKGSYITLAFNTSSGTAMKWYRDHIEAERAAKYSSANLYKIIDRECEPEPSPLLFLPYVAGSGTPHMDGMTGGALLGIRVGTTKAQIYKAILEGICFEMKLNIKLLEECGLHTDKISAVGGGAVSPVLMQLKADILGRTIETLDFFESGTRGLGIVCGHALGHYKDMERTAREMQRVAQSYVPNPELTKCYEEKYIQYAKIYPSIKSIRV